MLKRLSAFFILSLIATSVWATFATCTLTYNVAKVNGQYPNTMVATAQVVWMAVPDPDAMWDVATGTYTKAQGKVVWTVPKNSQVRVICAARGLNLTVALGNEDAYILNSRLPVAQAEMPTWANTILNPDGVIKLVPYSHETLPSTVVDNSTVFDTTQGEPVFGWDGTWHRFGWWPPIDEEGFLFNDGSGTYSWVIPTADYVGALPIDGSTRMTGKLKLNIFGELPVGTEGELVYAYEDHNLFIHNDSIWDRVITSYQLSHMVHGTGYPHFVNGALEAAARIPTASEIGALPSTGGNLTGPVYNLSPVTVTNDFSTPTQSATLDLNGLFFSKGMWGTNLYPPTSPSSDSYIYFQEGSGTVAFKDNSTTITSGTSAPGSTPTKVGDVYVDTLAKKLYFATGTSSSSDWTAVN